MFFVKGDAALWLKALPSCACHRATWRDAAAVGVQGLFARSSGGSRDYERCPEFHEYTPYAARTLTRNSSTALRSMPDWVSSSRAFASTSDAAWPVAAAAVVTPPIWLEISFDPAATDWMFLAISRVAPPCCSTAVEIDSVISLICEMVSVMPPIEATASLVEACIAATCEEISSVAFAV